jgi:protease II
MQDINPQTAPRYANTILKPQEPLRDAIYKEFLSRLKATDVTAPFRRDQYVYFNKTFEGKVRGFL